MHTKINNKGMTILELIISMAISIIVMLMIVSFISVAFRVFRKTSDDVNLQMEAQTSINQLVNMAMEAKKISTLTDNTAIDQRYQIYNLTGSLDYAIIYRSDFHKLYLVEMKATDTLGAIYFDTEEHFDQEYLLAEYVIGFSITSVDGDDGVKKITMKLGLGNDDYEISKDVNLRNYITPTLAPTPTPIIG